ncbi:YkvA family protein [Hymenobacter lapidiphilus]|uniref:YkvA family protein n=1 Tax=Hymenobacter sp. CCM 8763 TaxID=2303334 RepID=UPI0039778046
MKQLLTDAYEKASNKKDMGSIAHEAWETLQTMFRLIKLSASGEYTGLPTTTVVAAVAVTIYFLSPIDLIPDFIPVLGLLDDVALVAWFSTTIQDELTRFAEWENTRPILVKDTDDQPWTDSASKTESPVSALGQMGNMGSEVNKPTATQGTGTSSATQPDVAANTTDSSREPNFTTHDRPAGGDMGGNVR